MVALSSPVVTLDKLKLIYKSFCSLLYSTSTRYKNIEEEEKEEEEEKMSGLYF